MGVHRDGVSAPQRPIPPEPACARVLLLAARLGDAALVSGRPRQQHSLASEHPGLRRARQVTRGEQPTQAALGGRGVPFVILTIKSSVFLQMQYYKLFILICYILEGEFNTIHTFSFINLSVISVLAHGRK